MICIGQVGLRSVSASSFKYIYYRLWHLYIEISHTDLTKGTPGHTLNSKGLQVGRSFGQGIHFKGSFIVLKEVFAKTNKVLVLYDIGLNTFYWSIENDWRGKWRGKTATQAFSYIHAHIHTLKHIYM